MYLVETTSSGGCDGLLEGPFDTKEELIKYLEEAAHFFPVMEWQVHEVKTIHSLKVTTKIIVEFAEKH